MRQARIEFPVEDSCTSRKGGRVFQVAGCESPVAPAEFFPTGEDPRSTGRSAIARGLTIPSGVEVVKEKGVVKWFNSAKGYGFIQRSTGEDVFVHFSAIQMQGYRTLEEGAEVEFEVKTGPKGLQAENVVRVQ